MVKDRMFYKTLFSIALPAALQSIISFTMGTADTIMVGKLGEASLAGIAVSNQINTFLFSAIAGLVSGSSVLIAQYWGKKDSDMIRRIISFVFMVCCVFALAATLFAALFPESVLGLMTDDIYIINAGTPYFRTVCWSYIMFAATTTLAGTLRNVEVVMAALWTSAISSALNVFLNWIFIFGKFGFPEMGVTGAALATVISRAVELGVILFYVMRIQRKFPMKIKDMFNTKLSVAADYFRHGLPIAFGDSQWAFFGVVKAGIIGHMGLLMVSANAISDTIMGLGFIGSSSLAAGACVVVGKAVGEGNNDKAREYSNTIQLLFAGMAVVMASVVFVLRIPIANLFNVSDDVKSLAIQMIAIGAITLLGTLYHAACFVGINRGAGDGMFVVKVDIICGWLIVLPLLYLSANVWMLSLPLIYLMSRIDQCFKWIIAFLRLRGDKWIHKVTRDSVV